MKPVFLIAWREYKQYVLSRGFILFLILLPLTVVFGSVAMAVIEQNKPVRNYVVVDFAGGYVDAIDNEIRDQRTRGMLRVWNDYLGAAVDPAKINPDDIEYPFGRQPNTHERINDFLEAGGFEVAQEKIKPYLVEGALPFVPFKDNFRRLEVPANIAAAASTEEAARLLQPYLLGEAAFPGAGDTPLFAAVIIPEGFGKAANGPSAEYWSINLTDPGLEIAVTSSLSSSLQRQAALDLGLSVEALETIADTGAAIKSFRPDRAVEEAELGQKDRLETAVLPSALTYMLLTIIFGVGNLLLTNTIEERSNKIVEVLLSTVTADQLMAGKLIGIAAVGLTMPMAFLLFGIAALLFGVSGDGVTNDVLLTLLSSNLLLVYVFYFICAYAIFAMIFLAIGAMSNSLQDAQTFMGPLVLLVFLPVPFIFVVFQNPNGLVASILTWIPIYTPYAVMMRSAADPPMWEIVGATALMLAFAVVLARVMGRIFRNALLQSTPPKVKDIWRLAKTEKA